MATNPRKFLHNDGLAHLWQIICDTFVVKENGKGLFSGKYEDLTGTPTKLTDFTNDLGLDDIYLKSADAETTYVKLTDYNTKIAELEQADSTNLQAAKDYVDDAVGAITGFDFQIVDTLPATGEKGVIYLVEVTDGNVEAEDNVYNEYLWISSGGVSKYELIGTTKMDLTGYLKEVDIEVITNAEIDAICTLPTATTPETGGGENQGDTTP